MKDKKILRVIVNVVQTENISFGIIGQIEGKLFIIIRRDGINSSWIIIFTMIYESFIDEKL